jgi:hypothetical protein
MFSFLSIAPLLLLLNLADCTPTKLDNKDNGADPKANPRRTLLQMGSSATLPNMGRSGGHASSYGGTRSHTAADSIESHDESSVSFALDRSGEYSFVYASASVCIQIL